MNKFIEELYYGNINPQEHKVNNNEEACECMEIIAELEEYFTDSLVDDEYELLKFLDYTNAWGILNAETNVDNFVTDFRLGAKFIYDTFVDQCTLADN